MKRLVQLILTTAALTLPTVTLAQAPEPPPWGSPPLFGPLFGPGGPGGPGGVREERKLVSQFDRDGDKRLNTDERKAAREFLAKERAEGRNQRRGPRPFGRFDEGASALPGPRVSPAAVKSYPNASLYASNVLRTFFLVFEASDWEKELADFHGTDVEVPAKLTVDGKEYPDVGIHFRGASSYMMVEEGRKRSLNLSLDFVHDKQRLLGYRTVNLLNSHADSSFLHSVLYYQIARQYLPAPKANFIKLVINGESWGVYINVQQLNKDFLQEWFNTTKGARWKVPGSPRGDAGLAYIGDDPAPSRRRYELKTKDDPQVWKDLIQLCRTLDKTPVEKLEDSLAAQLDIEQALWFLALENAFINSDGYWARASDYEIYEDVKGRFHLLPYDANETFNRPEMGPRGGGPRINGVELSPFAGIGDANKPLLSRLLAVPALKTRYLQHLHTLAEEWLDWKKLGPIALQYQALIADEVKADTRKLYSFDAFQKSVIGDDRDDPAPTRFRGPGRTMSLKNFADQRRAYLLSQPEIIKAAP